MLVEIHALKNYPAVCLNRDDANMPKTVCFGGIERARISSQSLKRSWRKSPLFAIALKEVGQTIRLQTRRFPKLVCEKLAERGIGNDYLEVAMGSVKAVLSGGKKAEKGTDGDNDDSVEPENMDEKDYTKQVMVYSEADISAFVDVFAEVIAKHEKPKDLNKKTVIDEIRENLKKFGVRPVTPDIALFGRMVTNDVFHSVDGAMQVAHAFSVNRVIMESDFFVATDDLIMGTEELGAGMMDDADFNSSCFYINGTVDVDLFRDNMKQTADCDKVVKCIIPALIETIAFANPSGKQHSFAGNVLPSLIVVEIKDVPKPVTYANAFVKPVTANMKKDLVTASVERMRDYIGKMNTEYDLGVSKRFWFCSGLEENVAYPDDAVTVNCASFKDMVDGVSKIIDKAF